MRGQKPAENDMKRTVLEDWPWVQPTYNMVIDRPASSIKSVTIDPSQRMADINMQNNGFNVSEMLKD
ncbi:MAG TPA: hypothetical protein DEG32_10605 [Balneolaceae bacterium]|nr:hypothetical protein [Balneolaceae bacterium]